MELGLVDRVVAREQLDNTTREMAQRFAEPPISGITHHKRLVNFSRRELEAYFELENREFFQSIPTSFNQQTIE